MRELLFHWIDSNETFSAKDHLNFLYTMFYIPLIPVGFKETKFSLSHFIVHFQELTFVIWLLGSPIWSKLFTSTFYFLAHLEAKSTKQLGTLNHMFSPWSSITFFKVKSHLK